MAIRLADYSRNHTRRIRRAWFAMIIITTAIFCSMIYLATNDLATSLLLSVPPLVLQVVTLLLILPPALEPLDILSRAVTHVSKQVSDVVPPNVNGTHHEKTGLKLMVDTIYEIATRTEVPDDDKNADSKKIMLSLLRDLPIGVVALDAKRSIVYANNNAPVLTNERGKTDIKLLFDGEDTLDRWLKEAPERSVSESKYWPRTPSALPDETNRRIYDVFAQYNGNTANGVDTVIVAVDRTEQYARAEDDMDFVSMAAHELRGPITVIHGYIDVLREELEPKLQPDQVALFERLSVSASRLTGYINNILNVARYDRRHLKISLREDSLAAIYTLIEPDLLLRASTQNRLLQVTIPPDLPTVAADRNSLSEVMTNLVDNAIKYSHEGGLVQVTAAVDGDFVKCSIKDTGIGMPASVVSGLFTKFYRSRRSRQNVAGTGLGLYISRAIIESHGGSIGVRSTENEGSVFTFSVPIYSTVAEKLLADENSNQGIINSGGGWIKNHAMFKG